MPPNTQRIRKAATSILFALTPIVACTGPKEERGVPTPSPTATAAARDCGEQISSPPAAGSRVERDAVVFPIRDGIRIYDISSRSVSVLQNGLAAGSHHVNPQFLDARRVSFVDRRETDDALPFGRDSLYVMDIATRAVTEVLRLDATILSYRWTKDATKVVYEIGSSEIRVEDGKQVPFGVNLLCLYDVSEERTRTVRRLEYIVGRGGHESDERRLDWSPSENAVLVVDTIQPTHIYVVDREGRDLVPPRSGTFARWINDKTVIFRQENQLRNDGTLREGRWVMLDVTTGMQLQFDLPKGTSRPEISPDGRLIAFDDADREDPSTYVFDRSTGQSRLLVRGFGAPIWLSTEVVAVTAGGPCPPRTECNDFWTPLGRTIGVNVKDGNSGPLKLPTTGPFSENVDVILSAG
jgi:dipeptidyl aminopeptidase/acylaminoacyl peptidase